MMNVSSTNFNNKNQSKLAFGRALTTAETNLLNTYLSNGLKKADIDILALNLPVAAVPATNGNNSGIGNFSNVADFMQEFKPLTGFNAALFLPLGESYCKHIEMKNDKGEVTKKVRIEAPFSTDAFGLNTGYFDPSKLTTEGYGKLLKTDNAEDKKVLDDLYNTPLIDPEKTQYDNIDKIDAALNTAYKNYNENLKKGDAGAKKLQGDFDKFKGGEAEKYWLDIYAENKDASDPERYKFKQFLLRKQIKEMNNKLESNGIDRIIDIPVGANRELDAKLGRGDNPFLDKELGAFDGAQNKWVGWGIYPLNPGKKSAQDLAYWKANHHASLGSNSSLSFSGGAARLDCFNGNMYAADGNGVLPEYDANPQVLANQLFYGLRDGGADPNKSFAEHLPCGEKYDASKVDSHLYHKSKEILGSPIPKLSVAKWNNFGTESFDSNGSHEIPGYHKDSKNKAEAFKADITKFVSEKNYPQSTKKELSNVVSEFLTQKGYSEVVKEGFTDLLSRGARKIMIPFTDVFGMDETYNVSNSTNDTNWTKRLPEGKNWEVKYQEKLQSGYGFNTPEIIARVLDKKGKNDDEAKQLRSVLGRFGQLLREDGVKTQQAANEKLGADYIDPELRKLIK